MLHERTFAGLFIAAMLAACVACKPKGASQLASDAGSPAACAAEESEWKRLDEAAKNAGRVAAERDSKACAAANGSVDAEGCLCAGTVFDPAASKCDGGKVKPNPTTSTAEEKLKDGCARVDGHWCRCDGREVACSEAQATAESKPLEETLPAGCGRVDAYWCNCDGREVACSEAAASASTNGGASKWCEAKGGITRGDKCECIGSAGVDYIPESDKRSCDDFLLAKSGSSFGLTDVTYLKDPSSLGLAEDVSALVRERDEARKKWESCKERNSGTVTTTSTSTSTSVAVRSATATSTRATTNAPNASKCYCGWSKNQTINGRTYAVCSIWKDNRSIYTTGYLDRNLVDQRTGRALNYFCNDKSAAGYSVVNDLCAANTPMAVFVANSAECR